MIITLLTLLHVLIFVYWLGGDLGAFYSSSLLVDGKRHVEGRFAALNILNNVDMAPRTTLLLALPTGLTLAWSKQWIPVPEWALVTAWIFFLGWLALAWRLHLKHGASELGRKVDLFLRWAAVIGLVGVGAAGVAGLYDAPLFIKLKLIILGACIFMGLMVRAVLPGLGPILVQMKTTGPTPESDAALKDILITKARPMVIAIWVLLLAAAILGIATPV